MSRMLLVLALWCSASFVFAQKDALRFEVISIHPVDTAKVSNWSFSKLTEQRYYARPISLLSLIQLAYQVEKYQVMQVPSWAESQFFDVEAKAEGDTPPTADQTREMLRNLLADRFALHVHHKTVNMQGFELVPAKGGLKIKESTKEKSEQSYILPGEFRLGVATSDNLAKMIGYVLKSPVIDKSGFIGTANFDLKFAPIEDPNSPSPSIYTALEEQFGLKLVKKQIPVDTIVIDSVNRNPTEE